MGTLVHRPKIGVSANTEKVHRNPTQTIGSPKMGGGHLHGYGRLLGRFTCVWGYTIPPID